MAPDADGISLDNFKRYETLVMAIMMEEFTKA